MLTNISDEILRLKFKYFISDCMEVSCVGSNKEWEPHITKSIILDECIFS